MIAQDDIEESAAGMIRNFGVHAATEARVRVRKFQYLGDGFGTRTWQRIGNAIHRKGHEPAAAVTDTGLR